MRRFVFMGFLLVWSLAAASVCFALTEDELNNIEVYRKAAPSVVHIRSVVVQYGFFFEAVPSEGTGSGVVVDRKGHIMTNAHVIRDAKEIDVTLSDGSRWPAKLVASIPDQDLALVRIKAPKESLTPIPIGSSKELRVGQKVLAIGNPFGLQLTLTKGVISSLDRNLISKEGTQLKGLIQTDAAINPGNSGGPLLDRDGNLIGINTIILSPTGGSVGVGFAIASDTVSRNLPRLVQAGWIKTIQAVIVIVILVFFFRLWMRRSRSGPRW